MATHSFLSYFRRSRDWRTPPQLSVPMPPPTSERSPGERVVHAELRAAECDWTLAPAVVVRGWGYNGSVPGPTLEANAGDTLVVNLHNDLPEPTTIHWHGLRIPAEMDGTELVQHPVEPGHSFEYRFTLPDPGTFWYHPHSHETVQLERGLYGAIIVRGPDEPVFDAEKLLVLDDVKLNRRGQIAKPGGLKETHDGRRGDVRLLNGRVLPTLQIAAGTTERWRIVNASSARYVRLSLDGEPFRIIGTDGGLIERPVEVREVLLTPGERVELAVGPFGEGTRRLIGSARSDDEPEPFGILEVTASRESRAVIPERLRTLPRLVPEGAPVQVNRTVRFSGKLGLKGIQFMIEGHTHHQAEPVRVGDLQVWDLVNETPLDHPFHLHGFFFEVLSENGRPPPFHSLEDTHNVPPKGTVRIAWMPDDRPGSWMYHCHILEHHAAGMMAHFDVVRPGELTTH